MKRVLTLTAFVLNLLGFGQTNYESKRLEMIKTQLEARDIKDAATLKAMLEVKRHLFVPKNVRVSAYKDRPLPIGEGQTISQPYIVAYMTQALKLEPTDKVLEIGTGSGYQAAVLAKMVDSVYTIEIVESLAQKAKERLARLGYENVIVKQGDGYHGWPEKGPFDAIMVTAGATVIPEPLIDQLKIGGRIIIPVGPHYIISRLVLGTKKKRRVVRKDLIPVSFVPFTREEKKNR